MLTVVAGPPAAGKSTWVAERRKAGDLVVDFDVLASALGSDVPHDAPKRIKRATYAARTAVIDAILANELGAGDSWVIHSSPPPDLMERYVAHGAEVVTIDPGMEVALERAVADGRPDWTEQTIREWYEPPPTDQAKGASMPEILGVRKTFAASVTVAKGDDPEGAPTAGTFSAIVSAFGVLDMQGDVIEKGAFADAVERHAAGEVTPVVWSHDYYEPDSIIGQFTAMKETDVGLEVEGVLDIADNPRAASIHRQMSLGRLTEFSVGGRIPADGWRLEGKGDDVQMYIEKMELWEAGPCFKGANPETELLSVKSLVSKEGRVLAQKHVDTLRTINGQLADVIKSVESVDKSAVGEQDPGQKPTPKAQAILGLGAQLIERM